MQFVANNIFYGGNFVLLSSSSSASSSEFLGEIIGFAILVIIVTIIQAIQTKK